MSIAWHTFYRKGDLIDYLGTHDCGAICIMVNSSKNPGKVYGMALMKDSEFANRETLSDVVPPDCPNYETGPHKNTREASSELNKWIDAHPLVEYLADMPDGYTECCRLGGFELFIPGEEPTPEQVVDSNLANM